MVLWKFAFRHVLGRPGRATLTLLSVVIAVAAVTSVTIATSTTRLAYKQMFATVSGRASLEVRAAGSSSFDQRVIDQVVQVPGVKAAAPVIGRPTKLTTPDERTVELTAVGIDPKLDLAVRDYTMAKGQGRFLEAGDMGVLLEESFARNLGVGVGDEVLIRSPRQIPVDQPETIIGLLSSEGAAALRLGGSVFMSLAEAQYLFTGEGEIDSVAVVLDDKADVDQKLKEIEDALPTGLTVRRPATRSGFMEEILSSSEQGLHLASGFSLLLATFIILNTSMMNVGERRRQLSIMRAVGATRMQIRGLLYGESIALGTVGIAIGMLAGWAGRRSAHPGVGEHLDGHVAADSGERVAVCAGGDVRAGGVVGGRGGTRPACGTPYAVGRHDPRRAIGH